MSLASYQYTIKPHVALNVRNIDRSVAFYQRIFGQAPRKFYHVQDTMHSVLQDDAGGNSSLVRTGYAKFDLQQPNLNLVLNEVAVNTASNMVSTLSHLGVQLDSSSAVLQLKNQLSELGFDPREEMQVACCYAKQDKFWLADPDGNEWEFFVVLEDLPAQAGAPQECKVCA